MIRCNWEIARIANSQDNQGQNILTTYSHKEGLPEKEETLPTLKDSNGQIIHKHYSRDWTNQRWLLESLQQEIGEAQIQEFICNYGYCILTGKQKDGIKKMPGIEDNPPFVLSK